MRQQREGPDFVVDPSGNAQDCRHRGYRSTGAPTNCPPGKDTTDLRKPHSPQQPARKMGLIPIPIGLIIFLLLSLIRLVVPSEKGANTFGSEDAYREFQAGNRCFSRGDYKPALVHYDMALDLEPDVGEIYNRRGLVFQAMGMHDRALADFDRALELMSDPAMVNNNRAITHYDMGDYEKAIADLDLAIEMEPEFGKAYFNRGLTFHAVDDYDRAIADLSQAIRLSSDRLPEWRPPSTGQEPGGFREILDQWDQELRAMEYGVDLPSAYYHRALSLLAKGEYDSGVADLNEALLLQPDFSESQMILVLLEPDAPESADGILSIDSSQ
jgi:tetratricopeptide (TPR) repeat protein